MQALIQVPRAHISSRSQGWQTFFLMYKYLYAFLLPIIDESHLPKCGELSPAVGVG